VFGEEHYGTVPDAIGPQRGLVDADGDGRADHWIEAEAGVLASVVHHPAPPTTSVLLLALVGLGLVSGIATLVLLFADVERDVRRASRQVAAVAAGDIPEPMAVETFGTAELRRLVSAIDNLVGRITDANVAKYVAIEKGQEADRLKSQFLANMSHDLRSPLNSVIGFSELLMTGIEGEIGPAQLEMVTTIHIAGRALLQQIDDILDTAKIEAGRMELHREPTPPLTLISRAIQKARARTERSVEFETSSAPGLPPAFVDPYRTTQALENVLLFASEGFAQGTVEIQCGVKREAERGGEIIIRVVSPRPLVSAEMLQAQRGFYRRPGHTGLGLALPIARSIVEMQSGTLIVEDGTSRNLEGRAAIGFEIRLPALANRRRSRPGLSLR
jgi:signal transduction histidine kinase